jgi:hypothetical protein
MRNIVAKDMKKRGFKKEKEERIPGETDEDTGEDKQY